jgi:hypothetical protein
MAAARLTFADTPVRRASLHAVTADVSVRVRDDPDVAVSGTARVSQLAADLPPALRFPDEAHAAAWVLHHDVKTPSGATVRLLRLPHGRGSAFRAYVHIDARGKETRMAAAYDAVLHADNGRVMEARMPPDDIAVVYGDEPRLRRASASPPPPPAVRAAFEAVLAAAPADGAHSTWRAALARVTKMADEPCHDCDHCASRALEA